MAGRNSRGVSRFYVGNIGYPVSKEGIESYLEDKYHFKPLNLKVIGLRNKHTGKFSALLESNAFYTDRVLSRGF